MARESGSWSQTLFYVLVLIAAALIYFQLGKIEKKLPEPPGDPTPGPIIIVSPGGGGDAKWTWGSNTSPNFGESKTIHEEAVGQASMWVRGVPEDETVAYDGTRWEAKIQAPSGQTHIVGVQLLNGRLVWTVDYQVVRTCRDDCTGLLPAEFEGQLLGIDLFGTSLGSHVVADSANSRADL